MKRVEGSAGVALIECVNPVKNKWRVRWDVHEDGNNANYMEEEFSYRPTEEDVRGLVLAWFNEQTNVAILSGFVYEEVIVWLSQENQFNYKAAYDLAVQTEGKSLPVTFKFGTDDEPVYRQFTKLPEFTDFYIKAMNHIQSTLAGGWKKKETFALNLYTAE